MEVIDISFANQIRDHAPDFANSNCRFPILTSPGGDIGGIQKNRSVSIVSRFSIRVLVLSLCEALAAWAVNPDIPNIQVGAARGSIQQQSELGNT